MCHLQILNDNVEKNEFEVMILTFDQLDSNYILFSLLMLWHFYHFFFIVFILLYDYNILYYYIILLMILILIIIFTGGNFPLNFEMFKMFLPYETFMVCFFRLVV